MKALRIAFYLRGVPCSGHTPVERPLGGTESAMISMARALAGRGHRVHVFTEADPAGVYEGVTYSSWKNFETEAAGLDLDILICIRNLLPFLAGRWARRQIYFSPDAADQPSVNSTMVLRFHHQDQIYEAGLYSLAQVKKYVDHVFCVGAWQAETFLERFRIAPAKIWVTGNGVDLEDFDCPPLSERKRQIVYTSTPFRGLSYLLNYFPEIRRRVPDATCVVLSGMQVYGQSSEDDRRQFQEVYDLARQPGVTLHGPLPRGPMAAILAESRVLAYPNTFAETYCIAALEAQASGLPVVTTSWAGLKERVQDGVDGFLVPGLPAENSYRETFVEKVAHLLQDDSLWSGQSEQARRKAETCSYQRLSLDWERKFYSLLEPAASSGTGFRFQPREEKIRVLQDGYPKHLTLAASFLTHHVSMAFREGGFRRAAEDLLRKSSTGMPEGAGEGLCA